VRARPAIVWGLKAGTRERRLPPPSTTSSASLTSKDSDGWIATTANNMSDPGAFAVAGSEGRQSGEPPPLASAGVVVCVMT
jgi:hypothetical protein